MFETPDYEKMTVFEQIKQGLQESIAYSRGELTLRTTVLPAPPPAASPRRVLKLRRKLKMSQSVFAATLNVSPKLVQSWEQGTRKPDRGALRLLQIIEAHPAIVRDLVGHPWRGMTRLRKRVA
jgi:putative transcriptional regulator